ncbi:MAG: carbamoyltransferase C-terminal domain-containing protein [Rhodospirillales bacterium]
MTLILGLNAFHADAAACLVRDGQLIAAAEEERFRRIKHWGGFPQQAIAYCLKEGGVTLADLDHVAINRNGRAGFGRKLAYIARHRPSLSLLRQRLKNRKQWRSIEDWLTKSFPGQKISAQIHAIEHHDAHLASAFLVSPFENAAVASVDGFGDFSSAAWGVGRGTTIEVFDRVYFPHSLGVFYEALTQYLGFFNYGDEYKVMGLAPYGEPRFVNELQKLLHLEADGSFKLDTSYFTHAKQGANYEVRDGIPSSGKLFSQELIDLFGPPRQPGEALTDRHRDLARSIQVAYEEAFFNLLNALYRRSNCPAIALAGGCANNSVANGKIYDRTPFVHCYVQSAGGDAGGAIGAAYAVWHRDGANPTRFDMNHAYWGPHFSDAELHDALVQRSGEIAAANCRQTRHDTEAGLAQAAATAVADGKVVGWFQGRMEWGPRALGNRSILADPRRTDMKDILNVKIKRRESFRPFAPSILRQHVPEWFETDDDVPFMMQVHRIRPEQRSKVPAITHVDGTGRLQTVSQDTNPRYAALIEAFRALTGVPMVLNTSFNENEPVVCRPEEAINCFLRTSMDVLFLGSHMLER